MSRNGEKLGNVLDNQFDQENQDTLSDFDDNGEEFNPERTRDLGRIAFNRYQFLSPRLEQQLDAQRRTSDAFANLYQEMKGNHASRTDRLDALDHQIESVGLEIDILEQQFDLALAALDELEREPSQESTSEPNPAPTPEAHETVPASAADRILDQVLDKQCSTPGEYYFGGSYPGMREHLIDGALARSSAEIDADLKSTFAEYIATRKPKYQDLARDTNHIIGSNTRHLQETHQVGTDTVKVFLDPLLIGDQFSMLTSYDNLQDNYARSEGHNLLDGPTTSRRFYDSAMQLLDSAYAENGDTLLQGSVDYLPCSPDHPPSEGLRTFIHVNSSQPHDGECTRCYITADKTKDPALVLDAWRESIAESPLRTSLYYKYLTGMRPSDDDAQRRDDIVIYKYDSIDDAEFKALLEDFQRRCDEKSPDLLASDTSQLPLTTVKIADGISIASDPLLVNNFLRCTDHSELRHSWTTFVDRIAMLSTIVAGKRLGLQDPDSIDTPGLRDETHQVFREFMLLSNINPDTMLPQSFGDQLPSWAQLNSPTS